MKYEIIPRTLLAVTMLLALASSAGASNRWYVDGIKGSDSSSCASRKYACRTIGHAISLASAGDSVLVAAAMYPENLTIDVSLRITGAGASTTIIDGGGLNTVVTIPNANTQVTISKLTIQNGFAPSGVDGGGISNHGGWLTISNSVISRNNSLWGNRGGGGVYSSGGTLLITRSTITANVATPYGGGICINGSKTAIRGSTVSGNNVMPGEFGGGIANFGTLTIRDSFIHNNIGNAAGGGIYNGGKLTVRNTVFSGNYPYQEIGGEGGGIANGGTLVVTTSTFTGNYADWGGGVANSGGALSITRSNFSGNTALHGGGGIWNEAGSVTVSNSTLTGNAQLMGPSGGGAFNGWGGFHNVTISANSAFGEGDRGGGITGGGTIRNSIVANNSPYNCGGSPPASDGYNLASDSSCNFASAGDLNNTDPQLGPLQNNGGPTQTMALPPGSPAVDAGNPNGCTDGHGHLLKTDQRGEPRPDPGDIGVGCDVGAYELHDN
jgi:hypothetical protein